MVTPRRSARVAASDSSPVYTDPPESGIVRKRKSDAGSSPSAKRGKKSSKKSAPKQQTLEDAMDIDKKEDQQPAPAENGEPGPADKPEAKDEAPAPQTDGEKTAETASSDAPKQEAPKEAERPSEQQALPPAAQPEVSDAPMPDATENTTKDEPQPAQPVQQPEKPAEAAEKPAETAEKLEEKPAAPTQSQDQPAEAQSTTVQQPQQSNNQEKAPEPQQAEKGLTEHKTEAPATTNGNAVEPEARDDQVPSSILEKGIVYFFFRARVNITDPQDVNDIARSYMILRPLPKGAKLGDGPIGDEGNCRLLAIPKKVLPLSGKDRFMSFVDGAKKSFKDLKDDFLGSSDYATKTAGTSHSPAATPVAEGVYAITTTGRESHFAYMITIPSQLGEVQKDVGIKEQGSFVVSAKNPKYPGPANASLGKDPGYPQEIMDEFRDLRWMPLQPKLLDYVNTQFLLIGESGGIGNALDGLPRDEKQGFSAPKDEMEKLEGEDEIRVKHLQGDDAVFTDLGISKKEYPSVPTTWD